MHRFLLVIAWTFWARVGLSYVSLNALKLHSHNVWVIICKINTWSCLYGLLQQFNNLNHSMYSKWFFFSNICYWMNPLNSPLKITSKAPVEMSCVSTALQMKNRSKLAYICKKYITYWIIWQNLNNYSKAWFNNTKKTAKENPSVPVNLVNRLKC